MGRGGKGGGRVGGHYLRGRLQRDVISLDIPRPVILLLDLSIKRSQLYGLC